MDELPPVGAALAGRSVLVTGHTGFKGSWLALWLARLGARVSGYALDPPTTPAVFDLASVGDLLADDTRADIRDLDALRAAIRRARPEVIFHLAAQPLVRRARAEPLETFDVNVMGTVTVLEAVRLEGLACAVVVVTSDKCYEDREWAWGYRETDRLGGAEPYGASKAAAELAVTAYHRSYFPPDAFADHGVAVATARAGNVIGGGDWAADRILPDIVAALAAGRPVGVRYPGAVRPWQHVLTPLSGYLHLAGRLLAGPVTGADGGAGWNFGPPPGPPVSVAGVVDGAIAAWGGGSWETVDDGAPAHEARLLHLCTDKAVAELGWRPAWDLGESLRRTMAWYRAWATDPSGDARTRCLDDIAAYEQAVRAATGVGAGPAAPVAGDHLAGPARPATRPARPGPVVRRGPVRAIGATR